MIINLLLYSYIMCIKNKVRILTNDTGKISHTHSTPVIPDGREHFTVMFFILVINVYM